ncbi:hypothetical protein CRE_31264 [Caenorhabditis remanei]|uniref:Uncharacterized protein n=1 Tax=Caenorhabditis remanei TaxID=31234 RepID=E3MLI0_CAERE|nr:hypothetical protein CRE_31264 [Caenorhabditis remanei]
MIIRKFLVLTWVIYSAYPLAESNATTSNINLGIMNETLFFVTEILRSKLSLPVYLLCQIAVQLVLILLFSSSCCTRFTTKIHWDSYYVHFEKMAKDKITEIEKKVIKLEKKKKEEKLGRRKRKVCQRRTRQCSV